MVHNDSTREFYCSPIKQCQTIPRVTLNSALLESSGSDNDQLEYGLRLNCRLECDDDESTKHNTRSVIEVFNKTALVTWQVQKSKWKRRSEKGHTKQERSRNNNKRGQQYFSSFSMYDCHAPASLVKWIISWLASHATLSLFTVAQLESRNVLRKRTSPDVPSKQWRNCLISFTGRLWPGDGRHLNSSCLWSIVCKCRSLF